MKFINPGILLMLLSTITVFGQTTGKQTIGMLKESPAGTENTALYKGGE